jgi:glycosyltransferase
VQSYLQTTWDTSCLGFSTENKVIRPWQSKPFHPKNVRHGWMPPHPTLFLRKEVYEKHGLFDTSFKISGDYDFMLRVMTDPEMQLRYLPEVITRMRLCGARPVKFVRKHFTGQVPAVLKAFCLKCRKT